MKTDFPIFRQRPDLIYFDNAATAQKPSVVLEAEQKFYTTNNANIHRGPHFLSEEATALYEGARRTVANFVGAAKTHEAIFTKSATEAINLVARSFGETLKSGDIVTLSKAEHHANLVPWLQLKERKGVELRYFEVNEEGRMVFDPAVLEGRVKLVALTGMSNVTGAITDLPPFIEAAHRIGAKVLVDAAQLAVHQPIDVGALDIDFLAITGHKLYGPTGIGALVGRGEILEKMPPFLGGGDMVKAVRTDGFEPADSPARFEAGTPNIAGAVGLKAAIDYLNGIGFEKIQTIENGLTDHLLKTMKAMPFIRVIGPAENAGRGSVVSFVMDGVHPHDIAEGLSKQSICVRAGRHCAYPLHESLSLPATARASLAFYNTQQEIDRFAEVLDQIYHYFQ